MRSAFNRVSKIISTAFFIVLVILIILILLYIFRVRFLANNDKLGEVKLNFYTILSQSMYPTIKAGDIVVTYMNDDNLYKSGDVITYVSRANGGITITHRVQEVYNVNGSYSYKTKGDNNSSPDSEVVSADNVLGKVVVKIPKAGYIQQFMVTKIGWIVTIVLPCLGVVIYDILKIFKTVTRKSVSMVKKDKRTDDARNKLKEVLNDESEEE